MNKYYNRDNQYWKKRPDGFALLINTKKPGTHYDGDGHIFFHNGGYDLTTNVKEITEKEFNTVRSALLKRLKDF